MMSAAETVNTALQAQANRQLGARVRWQLVLTRTLTSALNVHLQHLLAAWLLAHLELAGLLLRLVFLLALFALYAGFRPHVAPRGSIYLARCWAKQTGSW